MSALFTPFRNLPGYREIGEDRFQARCPAHDDSSPSLRGTLKNGRLLIKCWAGCTALEVIAVMGLPWSVLFDDGIAPKSRRAKRAETNFTELRNRELIRLAATLRGFDAALRSGPYGSLDRVSRKLLVAAARDYAWTEHCFETLRTGSMAEAVAIYRESRIHC